MNLKQIIKLSLDEIAALRCEAVAGNPEAVNTYLKAATWQRINRTKGYSIRSKILAFRAITENLRCQTV